MVFFYKISTEIMIEDEVIVAAAHACEIDLNVQKNDVNFGLLEFERHLNGFWCFGFSSTTPIAVC